MQDLHDRQAPQKYNKKENTKFRKQGELTEALLAELRCGRLRVQLAQLDMDAVGIGLKYGLIDPEQAIGLLHDRDALPWMFPDGGSAA